MAPTASELGVGKRSYVTAAGWPRHGRRMKASLAGVRSGRSRIGWKVDLGAMSRWEPGRVSYSEMKSLTACMTSVGCSACGLWPACSMICRRAGDPGGQNCWIRWPCSSSRGKPNQMPLRLRHRRVIDLRGIDGQQPVGELCHIAGGAVVDDGLRAEGLGAVTGDPGFAGGGHGQAGALVR